MHFECSSLFFSLRMHLESFEHEQNIPASLKNVPEYLECTRNSVRSFRMHFDCQRMHFEFSFRRHSGSFRHSCDEGINVSLSPALQHTSFKPIAPLVMHSPGSTINKPILASRPRFTQLSQELVQSGLFPRNSVIVIVVIHGF